MVGSGHSSSLLTKLLHTSILFRLSNRSDDPAPLAQETIIEGRLLFNRSEHPHLPVVEVTRTDPTLDQAGEFDFLTILHDYIRRYTRARLEVLFCGC